jgi:riboflavin synthase
MFTGIVEEAGRVARIEARPGLTRLTIRAAIVLEGTSVGDSIAINGACLTVVARDDSSFTAEATPETLRRTNLGELAEGEGVHLERALAADGRIGGHFVQGHVDGLGNIAERRPEGDSVVATFGAPPDVMQYVVPKGSIAVDGVSLTVVDAMTDRFTVALIPHTMEHTLLGAKPLGARVNLEADILAKYAAKAVAYAPAAERT